MRTCFSFLVSLGEWGTGGRGRRRKDEGGGGDGIVATRVRHDRRGEEERAVHRFSPWDAPADRPETSLICSLKTLLFLAPCSSPEAHAREKTR